jgi:hypothetical protein
VVVKRGVRRAADRAGEDFFVPAFPLEEVFDPTGAGDSFAGGFLGYLAEPAISRATDCVAGDGLRRRHGLLRSPVLHQRIRWRTPVSLQQRIAEFHELTHVDLAGTIG